MNTKERICWILRETVDPDGDEFVDEYPNYPGTRGEKKARYEVAKKFVERCSHIDGITSVSMKDWTPTGSQFYFIFELDLNDQNMPNNSLFSMKRICSEIKNVSFDVYGIWSPDIEVPRMRYDRITRKQIGYNKRYIKLGFWDNFSYV